MQGILQLTVAALAFAPLTLGHTWIEQLRNVNDKGEYVGTYGYPRGMVSKTDPGFNGFSMNIELPAYQNGKVFIDDTTPLCHPAQRKQVQSQQKYPRLKAVPGGFVAMRYSENGHVTKPFNQKGKPKKGGTIFVYGTTEPKEDERLTNILQWTQDGKGGDSRGILLTMNDFDDGRCYEVNETPESSQRRKSDPNWAMGQVSDQPGNYPLMCETNVQLPKTAAVGKPYTFYWVWQWNTAPNTDPGLPKGKDEYYTTCIDVDVAAENTVMSADKSTKFDLGSQQDAMSVAVGDFASRTALMTNAIQGEVGPYFKSGPTPSPGAPNAPGGSIGQNPSTAIATGSPSKPTGIPIRTRTRTRSRRPQPTQQPSQQPSQQPNLGDGPAITVTNIVFVTVTGSAKAPPAAAPTPANPKISSPAGSPPAAAPSPANPKVSSAAGAPPVAAPSPATPQVSSVAGAPPAAVTPSPSRAPVASAPLPSGPAPSGKLPGFNFNNPNGAKFRRMHA